MQHIKLMGGKGDPLCPLGFHPQVRWPTRCKRCFRDYKEHGNRNKDNDSSLRRDETTLSSPSLSSWTSRSREETKTETPTTPRAWTSSSNLSSSTSNLASQKKPSEDVGYSSRFSSAASSWTSSPNLANMKEETVSVTLPRPRPKPVDTGQDETDDYRRTQYTVRRRTSSSSSLVLPTESSRSSTTSTPSYSSIRDRVRTSPVPSTPVTRTTSKPLEVDYTLQIRTSPGRPPVAPRNTTPSRSTPAPPASSSSSSGSTSSDEDDDESIAGTSTTATIVNDSELQDQIDSLKKELEAMKSRCERVEREKSDILLRRLASVDTYSNRTTASEVLKLQQRVNELQSTVEDLREDKKSLSLKVGELEADLEKGKQLETLEKEAENLRNKLQAAETLCEELMDENEDMKKELRDLEEEMDEMQDNFREDQADEYSSLKKELEQTAKNCRILSFKLRKAERKSETLEAEKLEAEKKCREIAGGQAGLDKNERIRHLEQELGVANEVAQRLQKELEEANSKIKSTEGKSEEKTTAVKKKAPMLGSIGKSSSGEKISRESLTRGGSQEDPVQLLRDLQDSLEREADLREQLRYAEEEAQNLRKKASRVEDDNESLVLQLKKMATKARTRKTSPTPSRLTPEPPVEKDEGISDEEDPAELRLLLELNEQEAAVLRRKVEELEGEGHNLKTKVKELQDKLTAKASLASRRALIKDSEPAQSNALYEKKMKVLEEEMKELRKKLVEKERDCERLHSELTLAQKKPKTLMKSKSLDGDQQTLDLKRQLQVVEQEANVLRARNQNLESDNEKLVSENKRLLLTQGAKKSAQERANNLDFKLKMGEMEKKLEEANQKLKEFEESKNKPELKKPEKSSGASLVEMERLKTQISRLETEKTKLNDSLKRLKEEAVADILQFYTKRTPKKPTDITTKLQMKKMVDELENEIGEILVALRKSETERKQITELDNKKDTEKDKFKTELDDLRKKLENSQKQLKDEKTKWEKEKEKLQKDLKTVEEAKKKSETQWDRIKTGLNEDKKRLQENKRKVENEKLDLEEIVDKLNAEIRAAKMAKDDAYVLNQKIETLNSNLREEKKEIDSLRNELESAKKLAQDREKQVAEKSEQLFNAEKKVKDIDDKLKKTERLNGLKKEKITKLEKELEEVKNLQKKDSEGWEKEKECLKSEISDLKTGAKKLELELEKKKSQIDQLEANVREERERATDLSLKAGSAASREMKELREELSTTKAKHQEVADKLKKAEQDKSATEKVFKEKENALDKDIKQLEKKSSELKVDLDAEKAATAKLKTTHEKEMKSKDQELTSLKTKLQEAGGKKSADMKEYEAKIARLEQALTSEKREYDELTTKYELLEEEHVVTKAKLVMDKENIQGQVVASQRELVNVEAELRSLQETYNNKQEIWDKEKKNFQDKIKDLEKEAKRNSGAAETWQLEKNRLNAINNEKNSELDQLKKDNQAQRQQIEHMHKEIEDYRRQMEDYEKVSKVQRNMSADTSALDREIKELKNKLFLEERSRKTEVSTLKMRYDNRVAIITEELSNVHGQVSRFKKERDTFRHMLEGAQRTIADLKNSGPTSYTPNSDEVETLRNQVGSLEQQISCMEDEMSETRLESSRLRTELVSERSAWEVKHSELMSKLNEMEEERILTSGRTKVAGLKSRLELAWTKEREDQHRLLQETSTLARDLRQTLFEVERERDKERLEAKRRHEQLKKATEEEQEENRKKLNEMQCDLLELRDAHAKLRTTNEKLRREKERTEKEKESLKSATAARRRADQEENHKVTALLQLVDELMSLAPELFPNRPGGKSLALPTPPVRRKGPKSRESSPNIDRREPSQEPSPAAEKSQQLQATLQRLTEATDELRRTQRLGEEERDRARKLYAARRAQSTESDAGSDILVGNGNNKKGRLYRKSLSLEQTSAIAAAQEQIWKDDPDGSLTSFQSLDDSIDTKFQMLQRRDPSLDSRLSGGSTQSEVIPSNLEKKKKKSLFGKLKKLTKSSRSVDQESNEYVLGSGSQQLDQGSDTSISSAVTDHDTRGSKRDLKDRLTGIFKKSGSTSRGNSLDRNLKAPTAASVSRLQDPGDSVQRPSSSLLRTSPSPARSDLSQSSTSRPLGGSSTPASTNDPKKTPGSAPLLRKVMKK